MPVFRINKANDYTIMANCHLKDARMSLKTKGLLSLMLSLPDNWDYSAEGLAKLSKDGRDGTQAALKELEQLGYLERKPQKNDKNIIIDWIYNVYEKPVAAFPEVAEPVTAFPLLEKPTQLNTKELNTNKLNTKELNAITDINNNIYNNINNIYNNPSNYNITIPKKDISEIIDLWNSCKHTNPITEVIPLSRRWNNLQHVLITFGKDQTLAAIKRLDGSEWISNQAAAGNKAKFDTWIEVNNIQKILEGNFDRDYTAENKTGVASNGYAISL